VAESNSIVASIADAGDAAPRLPTGRTVPDEFRLYRPRADHPDWQRLRSEADEIVRRVEPLLEPPRRGWRERRRRWRAYANTARNFATNRRLIRAGREDLRPLYFIWTLLRTCNFHCEYCDDHRGHCYPDLPNEGVLSTKNGIRLLRVLRTGVPSVYFSGGEPTLRKDLPRLTRAARDLDYYPIIVNTNGSVIDRLLTRSAWSTWLADTDIVIVSLDALHLPTLERMWAAPQPERVVRNLLLLQRLARPMRFKLMVNTVIQPGQIEHARDVLDFANDLGIWFCPVPVNTGPTVDRTLAGDRDYLALASLILQRKREGYPISGSPRLLRRLLWSEKLVCRNTLKPHVDYDGHLFWPCKASVNVEPRRIDVLRFENLDALYRFAAEQIDPTSFHGPGPQQCGASCNWAQNYSTDAYVYGLEHPWSLVRDIAGFVRGRGNAPAAVRDGHR
jgi:MoaA/NifB/PqqE/SkfB family radical SAM enzyme